ncbi:MAG: RidA family protein [Saprospiraceae bacterium]|jgi:enamine deaminase RidA (YjgF/YER057c/UK114 family)|nr:RidA family protein [Saprospiraceae bacterium]MBL0024805.1 RidA family protein [Saprospiraceae bacterium]
MTRKLIILLLLHLYIQLASAQDAESRLIALKLVLPPVTSPVASYVSSVRTGNLLYISGKGPKKIDGTYIVGKVGGSLNIEQGQEAARLSGMIILAELKQQLGSLNRVNRIVKVLGMVNATPDFEDHPKVINGFSDLMIEVFGDKGKHARSAVGVTSLPFGMAVEIEIIVEVID